MNGLMNGLVWVLAWVVSVPYAILCWRRRERLERIRLLALEACDTGDAQRIPVPWRWEFEFGKYELTWSRKIRLPAWLERGCRIEAARHLCNLVFDDAAGMLVFQPIEFLHGSRGGRYFRERQYSLPSEEMIADHRTQISELERRISQARAANTVSGEREARALEDELEQLTRSWGAFPMSSDALLEQLENRRQAAIKSDAMHWAVEVATTGRKLTSEPCEKGTRTVVGYKGQMWCVVVNDENQALGLAERSLRDCTAAELTAIENFQCEPALW